MGRSLQNSYWRCDRIGGKEREKRGETHSSPLFAQVFNNVTQGICTVWPFRTKARLATDAEVIDLVRRLHARLDTMEGSFASLRGYVYRTAAIQRPGEGAEPANAPSPSPGGGPTAPFPEKLSRDELRARLVSSGTFVPGKPPRHTQG